MAAENRIFGVEIITPDRIFYRGRAMMIEFNTVAGILGVYRNHIPLTTVLAPGIVRIHSCGGEGSGETSPDHQEQMRVPVGKDENIIAAVHSGFVEILPDRVTLLAEIAEWPDEIDKNRAEAARERAEKRLADRADTTDIKRAELALRKALVRIDIVK